MTVRYRILAGRITALIGLILLAACSATEFGPAVQVMAGPGKTSDVFRADNESCKAFAAAEVKQQSDAANKQAAGTALLGTVLGAGLGAATGGAQVGAAAGISGGAGIEVEEPDSDAGSVQQQYDTAFSRCMYVPGELVPGFSPVVTPGAVSDQLVRATQSELIRLGYLRGGSANGVIGPQTRDAIVSFQHSLGLRPDGAPSAQLLAKLQSTQASPASGETRPTGTVPAASSSSSTPASASSGSFWVAPTTSSSTPASASSGSGWVAPTKIGPHGAGCCSPDD